MVLPSAADESKDYVRVPIPYASIYTTDGRVTTLRDMSRVQARVLFFASPTCGSCTPILKTIPRWQKLLPQLGLHPVFSSEEKIRQAHKLEKLDEGVEALVDPKHAAMHNFGRGTPMAVILGSDGMLAGGPVAGTSDVKQLMDDLLVEFGAIKDPNAPKEAQPAQAAASASAAGASEQRAPVQGGSATQAPGPARRCGQCLARSGGPHRTSAAEGACFRAADPASGCRIEIPECTAARTRETGYAARAGSGHRHAAKRRSSAAARSAPTGYGCWGCTRAGFGSAPKNREEYGSAAACRSFFNGIGRGRCTAVKAAEGSGRLLPRSESSNVSPGSFCRSGVWGLGAGHCSGTNAEAQRCHRAPGPGGAAEASRSQQGGTGSGQTAQQTQPARVQPTQPANKPQPAGGGAEAAKTTSAAKAYRLGMRQQAVRAKSAGAQSAPAGSSTGVVTSPSASFNGPRKRYTPGASMLKSRRSPAELSVPQAATRPPLKPSSRAASASMAKLRSQQIIQKAAAKK